MWLDWMRWLRSCALRQTSNDSRPVRSSHIASERAPSATARIRSILDGSVNDSELPVALREAGLASRRAAFRTVKSCAIENADHLTRIDVIVDTGAGQRGGPIALPRGSHVLLVRSGKPALRLAHHLRRLVAGGWASSNPSESGSESLAPQARPHSFVHEIELRLLGRKKLPGTQYYHLLSEPHRVRDDGCSELQITTWDAFLAAVENTEAQTK